MIRLENVAKTYHATAGSALTSRTRRNQVKALDNINLQISEGEFVVICGPSGSGKTTLLMIIAALMRPTSGNVYIQQNNLYTMSMRARAEFRARNIGFIFQMFHLIPYLNAAENILLAGGRLADKSRKAQTNQLIEQLGLAGRNYHRPSELSAGEKQRVAIARALLNRSKIILADEPTGNLDADNAISVLEYLADFNRDGGTVILATHGPLPKQFADRTVYLRNGLIGNSNQCQ